MTLDEACQYVGVCQVYKEDDIRNGIIRDVDGWHWVDTGDLGIVAYFYDETMAFAFRLFLINCLLNPINMEVTT